MRPRGLVFDVDGTLAETEEWHRRAFDETFAAAGLGWHWDLPTYLGLLHVAGGRERIAHWRARIGLPPHPAQDAALHAEKSRRYGAMLRAGAMTPRPGIVPLIEAARREGLALGIATTTGRLNVEAVCQAVFGRPAEDLFDAVAAGDEVARMKPAPDVYRLVLDRLGLPAGTCVAFEDSANGVAAARAAGLATVACAARHTAGDDLRAASRVVGCFSEIADLRALEALLG